MDDVTIISTVAKLRKEIKSCGLNGENCTATLLLIEDVGYAVDFADLGDETFLRFLPIGDDYLNEEGILSLLGREIPGISLENQSAHYAVDDWMFTRPTFDITVHFSEDYSGTDIKRVVRELLHKHVAADQGGYIEQRKFELEPGKPSTVELLVTLFAMRPVERNSYTKSDYRSVLLGIRRVVVSQLRSMGFKVEKTSTRPSQI